MIRTLAVAILAGSIWLGSPAVAQQQTGLTVRQAVPSLSNIDLGEAGTSHGDLLAFEAGISTDDGMTGTLSGILITIDLPDHDGDVFEDRIGNLVFDFGTTDSIVVAGTSVYSADTVEMNADQPQVRAVIGGTGQFLGASGQVTTTRNDDGSYDHVFQFID
jgi:hypothetical protein